MTSEYCLNMNCGHHRKEHRGGTGQCTKCACRQGRYEEADKGQPAGHGKPAHGGGHKR